jgi:Flavinator of succinate dehydrogenase
VRTALVGAGFCAPSANFSTLAEVDESPLPQPVDRSYETVDVTRARLLYQSRKRGILETDLLLSTFANKYLSGMVEGDLREYDKVLRRWTQLI